ncbi:MAG: hypothetical protein R3A13_09410 [Bdellovibrionota bacterium]
MNKQARVDLRRDMDRVLANLDKRWIAAASSELVDNLIQILASPTNNHIENVLAWISHFQGEVDLSELIDHQLDHRHVYLPRVIGRGEMEFVRVNAGWEETFVQGFQEYSRPSSCNKRRSL